MGCGVVRVQRLDSERGDHVSSSTLPNPVLALPPPPSPTWPNYQSLHRCKQVEFCSELRLAEFFTSSCLLYRTEEQAFTVHSCHLALHVTSPVVRRHLAPFSRYDAGLTRNVIIGSPSALTAVILRMLLFSRHVLSRGLLRVASLWLLLPKRCSAHQCDVSAFTILPFRDSPPDSSFCGCSRQHSCRFVQPPIISALISE
jgi:hypothetical protein